MVFPLPRRDCKAMARILVAGLARRTRNAVRTLLASEYHEVDEAQDGRAALQFYAQCRPDLVVLDSMLPSVSGFDVCREIRRDDPATAILFLSEKRAESDKVLGLELGADDYVTIPFGLAELRARVNALLRRRGALRREACATGQVFRLGCYTVNGRQLALFDGKGRQVGINQREYALLRYFTNHPNEVARRRELLDYAWGKGFFAYSRTVDTHVCQLRRKIAGCGWKIETVCGLGYRLRLPGSAA